MEKSVQDGPSPIWLYVCRRGSAEFGSSDICRPHTCTEPNSFLHGPHLCDPSSPRAHGHGGFTQLFLKISQQGGSTEPAHQQGCSCCHPHLRNPKGDKWEATRAGGNQKEKWVENETAWGKSIENLWAEHCQSSQSKARMLQSSAAVNEYL